METTNPIALAKRNAVQASSVGNPSSLEEYAAWFNSSFTFAEAVVVKPRDAKAFIDIRFRGRA